MRTKSAAVPYVFWMAVFVVVPLVLIVVYAFTNYDGAFTLENFDNIDVFLQVFGNSVVLALIATAICLLIAYPFSYFLAQEGPIFRKVAMLLIMLPIAEEELPPIMLLIELSEEPEERVISRSSSLISHS